MEGGFKIRIHVGTEVSCPLSTTNQRHLSEYHILECGRQRPSVRGAGALSLTGVNLIQYHSGEGGVKFKVHIDPEGINPP